MRVQGDHENSLKEEMVGRGNTVAVVNIALTSLHCLGRGFDNQKAARPSGKSENEITSGDQTFKACICVGHWSKRYYILPRKTFDTRLTRTITCLPRWNSDNRNGRRANQFVCLPFAFFSSLKAFTSLVKLLPDLCRSFLFFQISIPPGVFFLSGYKNKDDGTE